MEWTNQHDTLFLRDVRASDLYETRKGSPERGTLWDQIAARLNSLTDPKFNVNKRSLRDRFNLLMSKFKAKNREEERASGISPEVWGAIVDIITNIFNICSTLNLRAKLYIQYAYCHFFLPNSNYLCNVLHAIKY